MGNLGGSLRTVDWNSTKLERFEKNFYVEDKKVSSRSEREIEDFRREKEIKVRLVFSRATLLFPHTPPGPRWRRSSAGHRFRRGRVPRVSHDDNSRAGISFPNPHSVPSVAYGVEWPRSCGHCPNRKREDHFFRLTRDATHQCVSVPSLHTHVPDSSTSLANHSSILEMAQLH